MSGALKSSASSVHITPQDVIGVINTNPEWSEVRRTDGRITQQNTTEKSSEIKGSLQGQKNILTDVTYNNTLSTEVQQNMLVFARSILMDNGGFTPVNLTASTIDFNSSTDQITDSGGGFTDIATGQWIFVTGATDDGLNRPYYVTNKIDANTLQCAEVPFDEIGGGASITIQGTMLRSGKTKYLMSVQGRDTHTGATNDLDYKTQIDTIVDALSFTVPETGILTGSADVISATQLPGLEPIAGQTDAAQDTSDVLGAAVGIEWYPEQIQYQNSDLRTFTNIGIDITRNSGTQPGAGKLGALCVEQDVVNITGALTSLRKAADPAVEENKFDNQTRFSMSVLFKWNDGKYLMMTMREMMYTDGSVPSANGDFANFDGTYDAEEDSFGTTIQFDTNITVL